MKRLIVNADDFGLTQGVNDGIIACFRQGAVTSASLLANGPAFEDAVRQASANPALGVGVHLNVYRLPPLLPPSKIPSLVAIDGGLPASLPALGFRMATGRIRLDELRSEWSAQVERVLASAIKPTHLDSEQHLHLWPPFFEVVLELAKRYSIGAVRLVRERPGAHWKSVLLSALSRLNASRLAENGVFAADRTAGVARPAAEGLGPILSSIGNGTTELIVHPGRVSRELFVARDNHKLTHSRARELEALLDPALPGSLRGLGIELTDYRAR